ncbi:MAG: hypothetical protein IJ092_03175 [Atopobiaceae bacterium]|nr:hypothetical protein [Atopobiaceae bacterium]
MSRWPPAVSATVLSPADGAADPFGHTADGWAEVWHGEVVPAPATGADVEASNRPDGTRADLTLHFPECCDVALRGCRVMLGAPYGGPYEVIGNPMPYGKPLVGYRMPADVRMVEG